MKLIKLGSKKRESRSSLEEPGSFPVTFPTSFRSSIKFPSSPKHTKSASSIRNKMKFSLSPAIMGSLIPPAVKSSTSTSPFTTATKVSKEKTMLFPEKKKEQEDENVDFLKRLERHHHRSHTSSHVMKPGSYLDPPREVRIDPNALPPSPMRDPNMSAPRSQERKPLSNLLNSPRRMTPPQLGEPVGDIGMKTQLWDAQRLVRVILGKAQSEQQLESGSILQAIRTFALMKSELVQLRKQQENQDPPTIMPLLSPSTCNTSLFFESTPKKYDPSQAATNTTPQSAEIHRRAIIEAAKKIQSLEQSLSIATQTIEKVQKEQAEKDCLLKQAKQEQEELRQQLRANNVRLSRYREQANKAVEQKDFRISKLDRSNSRMQNDIARVLESLSEMNQASKGSSTEELQQVMELFRIEHQSNISVLKGSLATF